MVTCRSAAPLGGPIVDERFGSPRILMVGFGEEPPIATKLRESLWREAVGLHWLDGQLSAVALHQAVQSVCPSVICLLVTNERWAEAGPLFRQLTDNTSVPCIVTAGHQETSLLQRLLMLHQGPPAAQALMAEPVDAGALAGLGLVGGSLAFRAAVNRLPQVADCDATMLISGETGTGKEVFARAIHRLSARAAGPFVAVNCGAIPVDLVENELFGHERGAYTHATDARAGLIAEAEGGSLFLDEIDSLPLLAQVKLLRFLQEKEYRALGSARTHRANVRVIAATNTDIGRAVRQGQLRQDLYYRLNIVTLVLPPLRQRTEDIPVLARHFVLKYAALFRKPARTFTEEALRRLLLYPWPGNVRELEHTVERAVAMAPSPVLDVPDLDLPGEKEAASSFREAKARAVREFEHVYLESLLLACDGNISRAAAVARKDRRAFWELLRKHRIDARSYRVAAPEGEALRAAN